MWTGEIAQKIIGKEFADFRVLDSFLIGLDGTPNKSRLGANAILAVSMATVVACARAEKQELYEFIGAHNTPVSTTYTLPMPLMNIINGWAHADNPLDIQECMIGYNGCRDGRTCSYGSWSFSSSQKF